MNQMLPIGTEIWFQGDSVEWTDDAKTISLRLGWVIKIGSVYGAVPLDYDSRDTGLYL